MEGVVFGQSVCPSVRLSAKNFYIAHIFLLARVRTFIFHMSILCDMTLSFGSKFKVISQRQGRISRSQFSKQMAVAGAFVFHKDFMFVFFSRFFCTSLAKFECSTSSDWLNLTEVVLH